MHCLKLATSWWGKTLQQADELIRTALKPVYNNLSQLTVTLLEKRLLISVMGYVKKPGSYDLAPDGNVQMALDAAGGLVPGAQLNNMQVRRGSTVSQLRLQALSRYRRCQRAAAIAIP